MTDEPPAPPSRTGGPPASWPHRALYDRVVATLYALPDRFTSPLYIEGVPATDLFTMNSALGAAIEQSVVESLNDLRALWDPDKTYAEYSFVRQTQQFPDVVLRSDNPALKGSEILMGIELKGWFVLSKEGEPSFRYKINPDCCAPADLLVVLPWSFSSVVSGRPTLLEPIVSEARFAAEQRNYHWTWLRGNPKAQPQSKRGVKPAADKGFYPTKASQTSDSAISDTGGNFGRVARCGVMDEDVDARLEEPLLGIPTDAWRRFLVIFADGANEESIRAGISTLQRSFETAELSAAQRERSAEILEEIAGMLRAGSD